MAAGELQLEVAGLRLEPEGIAEPLDPRLPPRSLLQPRLVFPQPLGRTEELRQRCSGLAPGFRKGARA